MDAASLHCDGAGDAQARPLKGLSLAVVPNLGLSSPERSTDSGEWNPGRRTNRDKGRLGATGLGLASPTFGDSWLRLRCWGIQAPRGWDAARRRGRTSEGERPAEGTGEYAGACEQGGERPQA